jgi:hypothetical protein
MIERPWLQALTAIIVVGPFLLAAIICLAIDQIQQWKKKDE